MEENFKTSFIPKKPIEEKRTSVNSEGGIGLFLFLSLIVFLTILVVSGGMILWKGVLNKQITDAQDSIAKAKSEFSSELIQQLIVLDKRIELSKKLLRRHLVVSSIFDVLEKSTLQNVSFSEMGYESIGDGNISLSLRGEARDYSTIALQSDVFAQNNMIKSPIVSDLDLGSNGNVVFSFNSTLDPLLVSYEHLLSLSKVNDMDADNANDAGTNTLSLPVSAPAN
ncbi:MAG: hypothetical protein WCW87_00075 [Candidatus Paceibacterota bacterium]